MAKEKDNSYNELRAALKTEKPSGAYVFYGEERFLLEHMLGEFKRLAGSSEFDLHIFRGRTTLNDIAGAVDFYPFSSEKTLTIAYDFDLFGLDGAQAQRLEALLSDIPDFAVLVFVFDTLEYSPDNRKKAAQAVKKHAKTVNFAKQEASGLISGVRRRFAALDRDISPADAEYLIFLCGGLMNNVIGEISKLSAYAKEKTVTRADIDAVAAPVTEAVVFALTDAMAERSYDKAIKTLDLLISSREEPIYLVALLGRQMRQLYSARLALKNGKSAAFLAKQWGMRSDYPARLLMKNAGSVSLSWCRRAVKLCADTDFALKSANPDKRLSLEMLIMRIAQ